jgi:hypothetical protein
LKMNSIQLLIQFSSIAKIPPSLIAICNTEFGT